MFLQICALLILAQANPAPKVVLVGDSIRLGYAPLVAQKLDGKATIVSVKQNGGDSSNILKNLEEWIIKEQPSVVHLNCGLHDLKLDRKTKQYQVPLADYARNLKEIVRRIKTETSATLIFATTTPILDARHAQRKAAFDRLEADVQRYNAVAIQVMRDAGVPVHDLHWVVEQGGAEELLGKDGTHYTRPGYETLAEAVADCVQRQLIVRSPRPLPKPASGPEAAEKYRTAQAQRDALVPRRYREFSSPPFALPTTAADWKTRRPEVLQKVVKSLGDLPPRPTPPLVRRVTRELHRTFVLEKILLHNGVDNDVSALLLIPEGLKKPAPAILWLHSSTPDKTQIITPNSNGGEQPLGEVFVQQGWVVLAPDAYWHGDREGTGPGGAAETGRAEQESLHKFHLWSGRTLWGMFVRDDQIALDYLCSRPEVDAKRIGATGISMGSTRAWWLAAIDERIRCTVGVACLTRYENLIRHGELRAHGVYYFVDGLLRHFDTEGVLALIAPRPYLALTGDLDAGSPADGIRVLEEKVGAVYQVQGVRERFRNILYPNVGHVYTPEMRKEMLAWFQQWLK